MCAYHWTMQVLRVLRVVLPKVKKVKPAQYGEKWFQPRRRLLGFRPWVEVLSRIDQSLLQCGFQAQGRAYLKAATSNGRAITAALKPRRCGVPSMPVGWSGLLRGMCFHVGS